MDEMTNPEAPQGAMLYVVDQATRRLIGYSTARPGHAPAPEEGWRAILAAAPADRMLSDAMLVDNGPVYASSPIWLTDDLGVRLAPVLPDPPLKGGIERLFRRYSN